MVSFMTVTSILTVWAVTVAADGAPSQLLAGSPGPATADCSTIIYDMMDCIDFLIVGATETTPKASCCSGFKTVLKANGDCICYALSMSASLGFDINMTRAEALPSDCRVSAPPASHCHVSASPIGSPVSASPTISPASHPVASSPHLNYPIPAPTMQPPAATPITREAPPGATPITREAPGEAPYGMASGPGSPVAAPSPARAGANAISVSFSAYLVIFASLLLFNA